MGRREGGRPVNDGANIPVRAPVKGSLTQERIGERKELAKEIRPHQLFTLGFGTIHGVGWIIVAGSWVVMAGALGAAIAFGIGALLFILISLCYAEMGTMYPHSGGEVVYVHEAFGSAAGFLVGWLLALFYIAITSFEALAAAWIIEVLVPGHAGPVLYDLVGQDVHLAAVLLGLTGMLALGYANYRGGGTAARFQDTMTLIFTLCSLFFIVAGITGGSSTNAQPLIRADESGSMWGGIIAVLVTTPAWYSGFNIIPQAMGELVDLTKSNALFVGLVSALVLSCLFYCGVIFSIAFAAPLEVLKSADLPVAGAMFAAFKSPWPARIVLTAGLFGIATAWNAMFFCAPRVLLALSRAGTIPPAFSRIHKRHGSPSFAIVFVGIVGMIGVLAGRGVMMPIINTVGICLAASYLFVCLAVLRLRRRLPHAHRPYRVPWHPWLTWAAAIASLGILVLALVQPWRNTTLPLPIEWLVLLCWGIFGFICWRLARPMRAAMTEDERRARIQRR